VNTTTATRVDLASCLERLPPRHSRALRWFNEHAGTDAGWPAPLASSDGDEPTFLATRAKGIYKPAWSQYALSIRQTLDGPYADREPVRREDGSCCGAVPCRRRMPVMRGRGT
jgi:putative restriction endonuclease